MRFQTFQETVGRSCGNGRTCSKQSEIGLQAAIRRDYQNWPGWALGPG